VRWFSRCGCGRSIGYQSPAAATAEFTRFKRIAEWTRREAWEKPPPKKISWFFVCPKVRHLQYKIRRLQYKIRYLQVFAGAAFYLYLPENILLSAWLFRSNYCFFVSRVHLAIEAGFGCSLLVASNVFVITNLTFTCRNKNDAPLWMGNPKCKMIALGWLSDERFPRHHRH